MRPQATRFSIYYSKDAQQGLQADETDAAVSSDGWPQADHDTEAHAHAHARRLTGIPIEAGGFESVEIRTYVHAAAEAPLTWFWIAGGGRGSQRQPSHGVVRRGPPSGSRCTALARYLWSWSVRR